MISNDERSSIISLFKSSPDNKILNDKLNTLHKEILEDSTALKEQKMNLTLITRKRRTLETEIQKNILIKNRNSDLYVKFNNIRLKLNKELIEYEIRLEKNEEKIGELREAIQKGSVLLDNMKYYLQDKMFIEFVKGLGVEYRKDGKFRLKNYRTNEVVYVESDSDVKNKIWPLLD